MLEYFGLKGVISKTIAESLDDSRVSRMNKKSSDENKKFRKGLRARQKGFTDKLKEKDPVDSYQAGGYWVFP